MPKKENLNPNKPEWLRILEQQSWQAELIISGIAIFGAMQLPDVVFNIIDRVLVSFSDDSLEFLQYFFIYLLIGVRFLITGFIIHFVLRAFWVGMLGLVSVFPEGIREKSPMYSDNYLKKIRAEFPDINKFNQKLDHFCSLILSITALALQMFLIIAFWVLVVILFHQLLSSFLSKSAVSLILKVLLVIIIIISFLVSLLNFGKIKETTIAKKWQYPLSRRFNRVFANIFYEPYLYILMTLFTNLKLKNKHKITGIIAFMVLTALFAFDLPRSNMRYFPKESFFAMNQSPHTSLASNYETSLNGELILRPVIQSDVISSDHLRLFIPWFARETAARESICGKQEFPPDLSKEAQRDLKRRFENDCMAQYYQISIDSMPVQEISFTKHFHQNMDEKGFLTYIPLDSLTNGKHLLKIEKGYKNDEGQNAIQHIQFFLDRK